MSDKAKGMTARQALGKLDEELNRQDFTIPLDALEAGEIAEKIDEAVKGWMHKNLELITRQEVNMIYAARISYETSGCVTMGLEALRLSLMARLRILAEQIGNDRGSDEKAWERTRGRMVMLDGAKQCFDLALKLSAEIEAGKTNPIESTVI